MENKGTIPQSGGVESLPYRANETEVANKGEIILNVITAVSLMIFAWLFVSYIDIIAHNLTTQTYASWNAWEIMLKLAMRN